MFITSQPEFKRIFENKPHENKVAVLKDTTLFHSEIKLKIHHEDQQL